MIVIIVTIALLLVRHGHAHGMILVSRELTVVVGHVEVRIVGFRGLFYRGRLVRDVGTPAVYLGGGRGDAGGKDDDGGEGLHDCMLVGLVCIEDYM